MQTDQSQQRQSVFREAHLRDYWKIVWTGRWTMLAVFMVVLGATAVWTFLQTPVYRATATVEVQPEARRLIGAQDMTGMGASGFGWFAQEKYHNTQIEIIKSRDVSQRVVRMLGLDSHPLFENVNDPIDALRGMIRVDPRRDTGLIEISISGPDPDEITQWVNAVAQVYVSRNFEKARQNVDQAVDTIRQQMEVLQRDLSEAERLRIGSLEETEIFDSENQEEIIRQRLKTYNSELTDLQLELGELADTLNQISRIREAGGDLMVLAELASDEELLNLNRERIGLEQEMEGLRAKKRENHPDVEALAKQLRGLQLEIDLKVNRFVTSLESRYELQSSRERQIRREISSAERESLAVARATSRYDIVKTDADTKKRVFDMISNTLNEVSLSAGLINNNVDILDDAMPPRRPIKPRKRVNLMVGAMLGAFLGLAAVFFLDYLDNTIRTPEDVEKYLGLSLLGVVPRMGDDGVEGRPIREAYQSLRTSIIFSSKNRQRRVVLVTSTGPREGKSSTAANLARTLAAAGDRVIIIDCDLRRPQQHAHHDRERDPGLTNYLAGAVDDTDWTVHAQVGDTPNLQILTSGPIPPSPPDLIGGDRFRSLVATLRERFDWVVIDSPPAATLADAALLASLADMIVLVVKHNATDRDQVMKTAQNLRSVNPDIAGVVLNHVDLERAYNKDYYYAGYYYEEDDKKSRRKRVERKVQAG